MQESPVDDILRRCQRFRILCVGRAGTGKSSLINFVFKVKNARVSEKVPGQAEINQEFTSNENNLFVLHDSQGFEPGDTLNFEIVREFIEKRSDKHLELKDQLHAVWLCTETPTAGGRVFESGDEKFLQLAHRLQIPVIVVFTQYDRLVRTKRFELEEKVDPTLLDQESKQEAQKAFASCEQSLEMTVRRLEIPMPQYMPVSVQLGYEVGIPRLVEVTRDIVRDHLGEVWLMWAMAQRASVPLKIETCVNQGLSYYWYALAAASAPRVGRILLRKCLVKTHQDIIACWNIPEGEKILNSDEFRQLMFYLTQDIANDAPSKTAPPDIDRISHFVTLVTAVSAPIAPPVAILGLTYYFVNLLSNGILDKAPEVQRLLIAYTVDLILVLESLFKFTLKPGLFGTTSWGVLKEAFEAYERSDTPHCVHGHVRSYVDECNQVFNVDGIRNKIDELIKEYQQGV